MAEPGELTFLFTDIEGSTAIWERDPEGMRRAIVDHDRIVATSVTTAGGTVVKSTGDGQFATFRTVHDALDAALEAQHVLEAHAWPTALPLSVRMGLHVGEAQRIGQDWVGREVNLAARVADAGHGGYVLLSSSAAQRLRGRDAAALVELGAHRLRGIREPEPLYAARLTEPVDRPLRAHVVDRSNLPAELDEFIGRKEEQRQLADLLHAHRVVTLAGPGGAGKTRLAVRIGSEHADRVPDGVWFADLHHAEAHVDHAIADAVGLVTTPSLPLFEQLVAHLRAKQCLLVIDNCEHVVDQVADSVEQLLARAPGVRVLATSRVVLDVPGEVVLRIGELENAGASGSAEAILGSAVGALFVARARQARPERPIGTGEAGLVAEVCRAVDGLPLGIELAAAQLRSIELAELPARLAAVGSQLRGGRRRRGTRHGSLEHVVAASYELLEPEEKRIFERLAVFTGSFSPPSVAAVTGIDENRARDAIGSLLDQSMIVPVPGELGTRYRLLETLRRFATERLDQNQTPAITRDLHLAWVLTRVDTLEGAIRTADQDSALLRIRAEHDNFRAARGWALERDDVLSALRITAAAPIDPESERDQVIGSLLARSDDVPPMLHARALYACATSAIERGAWQRVDALAGDAAELFALAGDHLQATYARFFACFGRWGEGSHATLGNEIAGILAGFETFDDVMGTAYASWLLSQWLLDHEPSDPRIRPHAERAVEEFRRVDATFGLAHAQEGLAYVLLGQGEPEAAVEPLLAGLSAFHRDGHVSCVAHALDAAGVLLVARGQPVHASELLGSAIALRAASGTHMRPWEQHHHRKCLHALERELDALTREAALAAGSRRDADAAVARATELLT